MSRSRELWLWVGLLGAMAVCFALFAAACERELNLSRLEEYSLG